MATVVIFSAQLQLSAARKEGEETAWNCHAYQVPSSIVDDLERPTRGGKYPRSSMRSCRRDEEQKAIERICAQLGAHVTCRSSLALSSSEWQQVVIWLHHTAAAAVWWAGESKAFSSVRG